MDVPCEIPVSLVWGWIPLSCDVNPKGSVWINPWQRGYAKRNGGVTTHPFNGALGNPMCLCCGCDKGLCAVEPPRTTQETKVGL